MRLNPRFTWAKAAIKRTGDHRTARGWPVAPRSGFGLVRSRPMNWSQETIPQVWCERHTLDLHICRSPTIERAVHRERLRPATTPSSTPLLSGLVAVGLLTLADLTLKTNLSGTLAIGPILTASRGSPRATTLVGAVATVGAAALAVHDGGSIAGSTVRIAVVAVVSFI